ncbi:hypothetical protein [Streptomyces roseolus]|uniref:hypothetical protein n=1 Tax=Streptomyces roseolus TaxID=67358 RepID=UPI00167AEA0F|nr:hypothetical protein [Streptomyces roseolus]GGR51711.1 hypothetical protein GCM10010282_50810 [Streptomyces roseolus]
MSAEIKQITKLMKLKRGRRNFDKVKEWGDDFEQSILPSLQELADKMETVRDALGDPLTELASAASELDAYALLPPKYAERLTELQEQAQSLLGGDDNAAQTAVEAWEAVQGALGEFEETLEDPRSYEIEDKEQAWEGVCTELSNLADALAELAAE